MKSNNELMKELQASDRTIHLNGSYELTVDNSKTTFFVGKFIRSIIGINASDKIIDGSNAKINLNLTEDLSADLAVFSIARNVRNLTIRNLKINVIYSGASSNCTINIVNNVSYGLKMLDCDISLFSKNYINAVGINSSSMVDTHMETTADQLTLKGNKINISCDGEGTLLNSKLVGVSNVLANSISLTENFIAIRNKGVGQNQQAIGVYNNGRFARVENNNIKANGSHNKGLELEQVHATGLCNEGLYAIITGNNIVGEWGGRCIGLDNSGDFANITANKILSTHTINGITIRNNASDCIISGNILTSTSRNPRIIEHKGDGCNIDSNIIKALLGAVDLRSSCGIYMADNESNGNVISCNTIGEICDCGILANIQQNKVINNNYIIPNEQTAFIKESTTDNAHLLNKLNYANIKLIKE